MALYDRSFTGNRVVALAQKLVFETTQYLIWGKWMKFNTPDKSAVNPNKILLPLINSPIIVHRELERKQGDTLEVPMLRALLNLPKYGTDQMAGHEERGKINNAKIFIDIIRHAFEDQDGIMMRQTTKDIDLAKQARPLLQNHYARAEALTQCSMAFYKGFSDNIISSNRFSQSQVSHPHVFIAGQGKVSYGTYGYPGNTAYEQGIVTESDLMGAGDVFDTQFLTGLRADDDIRKIPYLLGANGTEYRIIVAHHWQLADLVADPNFNAKAAAALSGVMAKENPYLVGCKYFWEDFAIFDGANCRLRLSLHRSVNSPRPASRSHIRFHPHHQNLSGLKRSHCDII